MGISQRQLFRVFIIPKKDDGVFGYISQDGSIKKKLGLVGDGSHNVPLPHKTQYSVGILNISTHPAEAALKIDGKFIGLFYLEAYKFAEIERSPYEDKGFVFTSICENSSEADFASENINSQYRGEVRVDIRPRDKSINLYEQRRVILQSSETVPAADYKIKNGKFKGELSSKQTGPKPITTLFPNRFKKSAFSACGKWDNNEKSVTDCSPSSNNNSHPSGNNIENGSSTENGFKGLQCETDFGGVSHDGSASMGASTDILCGVRNSKKISSQGFTCFGPKTHQVFSTAPRMQTKGLPIFVNFLKLDDVENDELYDTDRFYRFFI